MNTHVSTIPVANESPSAPPVRAFLFGSRALDFWLLGGLSLALWLPLYFLIDRLGTLKALGTMLPTAALVLGYVVNHPHFMASYKLAYGQGRGFVLQNWLQLIVVPVVMLVLLGVTYANWDEAVIGSASTTTINRFFESVGLATRIGLQRNLGREVLGYFVQVMYFTVGWHYAKQTFGCMMVYAKFDGYTLNAIERNLLRYGLLSTWWLSWLYSNCSAGTYPFFSLSVYRLNLPYVWFQVGYVVVGALFAAIIFALVARYWRDKRAPSWNFLVPMLALLTWHVPFFGQPEFFVVIALFHSLQYFPFVAKVELTRYRMKTRRKPGVWLLGFFALMVVVGYLAFYFIPGQLDAGLQTFQQQQLQYFLISILVFINIHHYFIDNVLWRFNKNKEVRELLFR